MEYIDIKAIDSLKDLVDVLESQGDEFNRIRARFLERSVIPLLERKVIEGGTNGERCTECKYHNNSQAFLVCCNCMNSYESRFEPKKKEV